ncbi:MAG: twin-arginine translocase TatA/TatE family subunit [Lachnospiraceae bacterium]|nr:twin-arginine translocase TatA/TatE family subunit [Lachnospiraceae bacterium]MCD8398617.1 twin-arginine translocase TatA/TatE family subunit [Lachnospiraceae bacterium]
MKLGTTELLIILAIILLLFGPSQIPKLSKMFGKAKKNFDEAAHEDDVKTTTASETKSETTEQ